MRKVESRYPLYSQVEKIIAVRGTAYTPYMRFLFVDSNLFLQCRPLQDLDWGRLFGQEEVTILVPSAVLAELDKHKSDGNSRRAQRARSALKFLDSLLDAPDNSLVVRKSTPKVVAQFAPEIAGDVSRSNDDSILAEVADMSRSHGNQAVALLTHDTNLKVKAKRKGLKFYPVPDDWLLAPEPDARDKRLRQLEEEVALLKTRMPIMEITLVGSQEIDHAVASYEPLTPNAVNRLMDAIIAKFPMKQDFSVASSNRFSSERGLAYLRRHPPADREIERYQNEEYPKWEQSLRSRLEQFHLKLRIRDATADIRAQISNTGTVSGEHVHVAIRASEGFVIIDPKRHDKLIEMLAKRPFAPSPPQPRQTTFSSVVDLHRHSGISSSHLPQLPIQRERANFYRKIGNDIDTSWLWECENMRHGVVPHEFSFRIGMKVLSQPSGGQITIEVSAENLAQAAVKQFRIKITKVHADTERAANEWLGLNEG